MDILSALGPGCGEAVLRAASLIGAGGIVAFPTETFYGLGVRYNHTDGIRRLCDIKRRPPEKAIPLIIGDMAMLQMVAAKVDPLARSIAESFWPGPLTILFEARDELPSLLTAGTGKVAVRIPGPSIALSLARALPFPITATSANISGTPPAGRPEEVISCFGDSIDMLLDGGPTPGGRPSTIIDVSGGRLQLLREGIIPFGQITKKAP